MEVCGQLHKVHGCIIATLSFSTDSSEIASGITGSEVTRSGSSL